MSLEADLFFWLVARAFGLAAFLALCLAMLSGIAVRTSVLGGLATERAWRELHELTAAIWLPLGGVHLLALLNDATAQVVLRDLLVPFGVSYGPLAVGLGTVGLDLVALVAVTGWVRREMPARLWRSIHRLAYPAFLASFVHAVMSGTDFSAPAVSAIAWGIAFAVLLLALARMAWGRLPA